MATTRIFIRNADGSGGSYVRVTIVRMPWNRWAIRLRWAMRNALRVVTPAVASMVEMQKHIG